MNHLEIQGLTKRFDLSSPPAVHDVSFQLKTGEILGLLGPSGCGKTTTLRMIAGFTPPDGGEIFLEGASVASLPPERRRIGFVFQDYALFPNKTVLDNVIFALHRKKRPLRKNRARDLLALVGLSREEHRFPHELSGGQQQRVALARTLAAEPELILLDEPFSNLDAALRESTRADVRSLLKCAEMSAILVTHDQEEALSFCDTLGVMNAGTLEQTGTPEEIYLNPRTAFVAQFLGRANLLRGTATGSTARTDLGEIAIHPATDGSVLLSLRPEHLTLLPLTEANSPDDPPRITSREFRGHDLTYRVKFRNREFLVHTDYTCDYPPGSAVALAPRRPGVVLQEPGLCFRGLSPGTPRNSSG
ncbi:iron(III) transport system ATP-binding protein [Alkalispirochaeta americana]|uniref:Iron(III) transport system ATP-binding protein n=1 Tax=Alkalispirochaeta americana TaxID=159291 RepID=A0A1N6UD64_9SPIO|nr:ABC transporter ATP-binding protein [Alkalispirochaeta americana]SIQ63595.1 iron(III) transport system ATP-binding protein [Alkalispirochaeta americana]